MKNISTKQAVILNGFPREQLFQIVRAIKAVVDNPDQIAFGSLTQNNQTWTLEDLIVELHREHDEVHKIEN